jgi:hypothetical protein
VKKNKYNKVAMIPVKPQPRRSTISHHFTDTIVVLRQILALIGRTIRR